MKPILFSTLMVKAILEGRKTQTRRIIKPQPLVHNDVIKMPIPIDEYSKLLGEYTKKGYTQIYTKGVLEGMIAPLCKYEIGDVLWVRETWTDPTPDQSGYPILYKADFPMTYHGTEADLTETITLQAKDYKWKPSLFMPRDACRLFLKIKNIRVERLQDISEDDACDEGIEILDSPNCDAGDYNSYPRNYMISEKDADGFPYFKDGEYIKSFQSLWESINGEKSWEDNPFVWVIEFEKHNEN